MTTVTSHKTHIWYVTTWQQVKVESELEPHSICMTFNGLFSEISLILANFGG